MPRYEYKDEKSSKFWQINLEGESFTTTYGKIGSEGKSTSKSFGSEAAAEAAYQKAILSKTKKGYALVEAEDSSSEAEESPSEAEASLGESAALKLDPTQEQPFLDALKQSPYNIDAYLAYGKWLRAKGHPRGALIEVQHERLLDRENKALIDEEQALLEGHKDLWYGDFAEHVDGDQLTPIWWMGFIKSIKIKASYEAWDNGHSDMDELIHKVLSHRSLAFLQDLVFGIMVYDDNDYFGPCQAISEVGVPTLRSLFVGDFFCEETELNWSSADITPLYPGVPNLRSLTVRSGNLSFGDINLPELREFDVISGGTSEENARSIVEAHWPKLERLNVQFGPEGLDNATLLQPILDAKGLSKLAHLGITNSEFASNFLRMLPGSKILPQLDEIDLKMGTLGDEDADFLLENQAAFAHLKLIELNDNFFSDDRIETLQQTFGTIFSEEQREPGLDRDDRYASMYE